MNRIMSVTMATLLVISATLQAGAVITQEQAIQAVKNFIGNQNAQVAMTPGVTGITQPETIGLFYDYWSDNDTYYDMTSGNYQYYVNANTGFIDSVIVTSDLSVYPADALNVETMWSKYSMLPRSQMQQQTTDSWVLRYADGSWDTGVQLSFSRDDNGLIDQAVASYEPVPSPRPAITVTSQQALTIAQTVSGSYSWQDEDNNVHSYPYSDLECSDGVYWQTNQQGLPEPVYTLTFVVSSDANVDASWVDDSSSNDLSTCARYVVYVNAANGSIIHSDGDFFLSAKEPKPAPDNKIIQKLNNKTTPTRLVPLRTLQSLAKGHKLSAKAGEKAFTMDGKRIALPSKVVAKVGTLYLPWQALKSLPGVKCSYDAKLNRLDITTTPAVKKAK